MLKISFQENNINTANLYMKERPLARVSPLSPSVIDISGFLSPERARVEAFIKSIYREKYAAEISVDYPVLMSVRNESGEILAALGFRYAGQEDLFLESYTQKPIESFVPAKRQQIVEIGNLASAGHGASIFLFAALASYLDSKGIQYATITGTDYLHGYFKRIGLNPQEICRADMKAVSQDGQKWGTYYNTQPRVLIGSVQNGVKRLKKALGMKFEDCRPRLYPRLHYKNGASDDI